MKRLLFLLNAIIAFIICDSVSAVPTRATIWGFGGSNLVSRADLMTALFTNEQQLLWANLQGKYGESATWMASAGLGYRHLFHQERILGAYIFLDNNKSPAAHSFCVLSPGVESLGEIWDFRLNSYFPVSSHAKPYGKFCREDDGSIFVTGHQQYNHLFDLVEAVGKGVDAEIGCKFDRFNNARTYVGGYHFNFDNNMINSVSSVQGISARLEYPLRPHMALQLTETYDNLVHNTFLAGLQFSFGSCNRCDPTIYQRLFDPVSRNLGATYTGSGVPIVQGLMDRGENILQRDNIYFFDATQGSIFDPALGNANGTAEQPLIGNAFNQATIDAINLIQRNANFYFTPGNYTFIPAPNGRITLNQGQSLWGRVPNYTLPAIGDARALFIGGLDLFFGDNRLDSVRLLNEGVGPIQLIALEIENASNVVLLNADITAKVRAPNLGFSTNSASGIYGNNSQVTIINTEVTAFAVVDGDNNGFNAAAGIGGNSDVGTASCNQNNYTLVNSNIAGYATVNGSNNTANFATGIGGNTLFGVTNFAQNNFLIQQSTISGHTVTRDFNNLENFATGIGGNYGNFQLTGDASFIDNSFIVNCSHINGTAFIGDDNAGDILGISRLMPQLGDGFSFNYATGIGSNVRNFDSNSMEIVNSTVEGLGVISGTNTFENFVTGIGGNFGDFLNNTIHVTSSAVLGDAIIGGANDSTTYVTSIGGNAGLGSASFVNNEIALNNSKITANTNIGTTNSLEILTVALGGNFANFTHNSIQLSASNLEAMSGVKELNSGINFVTGLGGGNATTGSAIFSDNVIDMRCDALFSSAISGSNAIGAMNQSVGLTVNNNLSAANGNLVNINDSSLNVLARILQLNQGSNTATGLVASGSGDLINISDSLVTTFALEGAGSLGINSAVSTLSSGGGNVNLANVFFLLRE